MLSAAIRLVPVRIRQGISNSHLVRRPPLDKAIRPGFDSTMQGTSDRDFKPVFSTPRPDIPLFRCRADTQAVLGVMLLGAPSTK